MEFAKRPGADNSYKVFREEKSAKMWQKKTWKQTDGSSSLRQLLPGFNLQKEGWEGLKQRIEKEIEHYRIKAEEIAAQRFVPAHEQESFANAAQHQVAHILEEDLEI